MQYGLDAKYLNLSEENVWINFPVESSSPSAISEISKFCWSQKIVLAEKWKPVITRCQVHLTLMRGRVSNREITIIAKTNKFYNLIWIPLLSKDKERGGKLEKIKKVIHSFDKTRGLNKNSTWILNGKIHYIFLSMDRAHGKTKYNWTKCRPFQGGMFHSTVWFTQAKHCRKAALISNRDYQHGIYFLNQMLPMFQSQLHQSQCTAAILFSGTRTDV